ncbi:MAG: dihydroorotase [Chloroflexota bacterium]
MVSNPLSMPGRVEVNRMVERIMLKNVRCIDPVSGTDEVRDVCLVEGREVEAPGQEISDTLQVDCTGAVLSPAFIDLHCHLREPGLERKETIRSGTAAAAAGGFASVCCMPNTRPPLDNAARIREVLALASREAFVNVLPVAAVTVGQQGTELVNVSEVVKSGAVGLSDDGRYVADPVVMRDALRAADAVGMPVMDHAQDDALVAGGVIHEGDVSRATGLAGMPAAAEEIAISRDIALARLTGAHVHIQHVTTWRGVDLIRRAKLEDVHVTAEATPHHLTLTDNDMVERDPDGSAFFNANAKVNPPLRTLEDVRSLISGLLDGTIDAIATDHAPHSLEDKSGSPGEVAFGISGFETALAAVLELHHRGRVDLLKLVRALTTGPASILGNRVSVSMSGNLVLFDPALEWVVDTAAFLSRGANTPLAGRTVRGKVLATLCNGTCVFAADELNVRIDGNAPAWWMSGASQRASRETAGT